MMITVGCIATPEEILATANVDRSFSSTVYFSYTVNQNGSLVLS